MFLTVNVIIWASEISEMRSVIASYESKYFNEDKEVLIRDA